MSLLEEQMEKCTMLDKITHNDDYGGSIIEEWIDGASFDCAVVLDNSTQARIAAKTGVVNLYTATVRKSINLQKDNVFRRESDMKIFRVTSDGDDDKTPKSAGLNMRQVSCEQWSLPSSS